MGAIDRSNGGVLGVDNTSKSERETLEIIIDLVRKHCPTI